MNHAALMAKLATLHAFLERHPSLPHPTWCEADSRVYGDRPTTPRVSYHLGLESATPVEDITAIADALDPDGWDVLGNSVEKVIDGVEVTIFLPERNAAPGLAAKLMSLGWTAATEDAI